MKFVHVELENWRNFRKASVGLADRAFIVGPNAVGKSNFLDALRFLRDLVTDGGGLARALEVRGGMKRVRSLHPKGNPSDVRIHVSVRDDDGKTWGYDLSFNLEHGAPHVTKEIVTLGEDVGFASSLLVRPDRHDEKDSARRTQTAIQQINANKKFRLLADFFRSVHYLHLVPQLIREGQASPNGNIGEDLLGRDLMQRMRATPLPAPGTRVSPASGRCSRPRSRSSRSFSSRKPTRRGVRI